MLSYVLRTTVASIPATTQPKIWAVATLPNQDWRLWRTMCLCFLWDFIS